MVLDAIPDGQLRCVDAGEGRWESIGPDGGFALVPRSGRFPGSWVVLDAELDVDDGAATWLHVAPHPGPGGVRVKLPSPWHGRLLTTLRLPPVVHALRLAPRDRPGAFRFGTIAVEPIGGLEAGWRRLRRLGGVLVREPGRAATLMRRGLVETGAPVDEYACWVARFDTFGADDHARMRARIATLPRQPRLTLVAGVGDAASSRIAALIASVSAQIYPTWELWVVADPSTPDDGRAWVAECSVRDTRIRLAADLAEAAARTTGEFLGVLDVADRLAPHALYLLAEEIAAVPDVDVVYADEDEIDDGGRRQGPRFLPDWNPDWFRAVDYLSHLRVQRTAMVRAVGLEGRDLTRRCLSEAPRAVVRHVPFVLGHRATRGGSRPVPVRVSWPLPDPRPLVTLVVPTRDGMPMLKRCVESVLRRTDYPAIELLVVDNQSRDPRTLAYLETLAPESRVRVLRWDRPFNYAAINNHAVRTARGTLVGLLNDDVEALDSGWLTEMVSQALRPEIGAVGALLLYPDGTVQHAGVVTGLWHITSHLHRTLPATDSGWLDWVSTAHDVSAVTGACLVVRRALWDTVGGLDEETFPIAFNDVDFCLRLEAAGYRNLYTPHARLRHHESFSRGPDTTSAARPRFLGEVEALRARWGRRLLEDPAYNPNLSLHSDQATLAWPPRVRRPWRPE